MAETKIKMLRVVHPNGYQHLAVPGLRDTLEHQNSLKKPESKLTIEEVELTQEEIAAFPPHDSKHRPATAAQATELRNKLTETELENEELKRRLAELEKAATADPAAPAIPEVPAAPAVPAKPAKKN